MKCKKYQKYNTKIAKKKNEIQYTLSKITSELTCKICLTIIWGDIGDDRGGGKNR